MRTRLLLLLTASPLTILIASCANTSPSNVQAPTVAATVEPDACTWLKPIRPDATFETRWTTDEKRQILALDQNITKNCGTK